MDWRQRRERSERPGHDHAAERQKDLLALVAGGSALAFAWWLGRGSAQACCNQLAILQQQGP
jgi:hypothetical protein